MKKAPRTRLIFGVRRRPGKGAQGILSLRGLAWPCAIGKGGISARKREGDGATPLARLKVLAGYGRRDGIVGLKASMPMTQIGDDLGWCDAPGDRNYNRPVRLPYAAGHENMRRPDHLYDVCLVLDWNIRPRIRNRGSAIFVHLARPGFPPTEGCIAVAPRTMARLLPLIGKGAEFRVMR